MNEWLDIKKLDNLQKATQQILGESRLSLRIIIAHI